MTLHREVWLVFCFEFSKKGAPQKLHGHHARGVAFRARGTADVAIRKIALRDEAAMVAPESIIILRRFERPFLFCFGR